MTPLPVLAECREEARGAADRPVNTIAAVAVKAIWVAPASMALWPLAANILTPLGEAGCVCYDSSAG